MARLFDSTDFSFRQIGYHRSVIKLSMSISSKRRLIWKSPTRIAHWSSSNLHVGHFDWLAQAPRVWMWVVVLANTCLESIDDADESADWWRRDVLLRLRRPPRRVLPQRDDQRPSRSGDLRWCWRHCNRRWQRLPPLRSRSSFHLAMRCTPRPRRLWHLTGLPSIGCWVWLRGEGSGRVKNGIH